MDFQEEKLEQAPSYDAGVTALHIQELIDTNKALRESVISIAALLQEQSKGITYPRRTDSGIDAEELSRYAQDNRFGQLQQTIPGASSNWASRKRRYEKQWREVVHMSSEAIENERTQRRQAYEGDTFRSNACFPQFSDQVLDHWTQPSRDVKAVNLTESCPTLLAYDDPWWDIISCTLREISMADQPQSRKFDTALHSGLHYDLFIALFGLEFNYKWCDASRAAFEESRRFRLGQIVRKLQDTGAVAYFGKDFAQVLIEVAEWTKMVWIRKPEGLQTLEGLRMHCYCREVLPQPLPSEYQAAERQNEGLLAILYALDLRKWWTNGAPWERVVKDMDTDTVPLDTLISLIDQLTGWNEKTRSRFYSTEPSKDMSVDPADVNSKALRDLGDLQIVWTAELDMHLRISLDGKKLYVFQYPTWLIGRRFHDRTSAYGDQGDAAESNKVFHDLAETYALLFGPSTRRETRQLRDVLLNTECKAYFLGVPLWRATSDPLMHEKVILHPEYAPTRAFLDNFRTIDLPYSMEPAEAFNSRKSTMADALRRRQPYHDDMSIMMLSIIRYYPLSGSFNWSGSRFEEQLRVLKAFMDGKKPRTIGQLWKDARDATSWWTFWAVLFFGIVSILLALGSLIVAIVQTVGTFQAID
ncbi:hypothetical protein MMC11_007723 [Xylographa trunciseda]|nr:hypothetical protein [Xylographa trunciseda]